MPAQRPFFLSSFFASFRQQTPSLQAGAAQANKHSSASAPQPPSAVVASAAHTPPSATNIAIHSPRGASPGAAPPVPIPSASSSASASSPSARRRGSDSSSEGFRDAIGAEKWYIGGRTAAGEEKFFKLGVIRRVRSNDGLSLDRLSL
ncbi:hypothetical protein ESCO_003919 [Escovopsis weberi]|uniref:Uncharacterized protein n=1 Tax=Escovopsis weberi TaxID=150374 RepID=A0A0M8N9J8_ESCWE|nr:hypothetical protein ESCO_003919 [Escovopsis weberi]